MKSYIVIKTEKGLSLRQQPEMEEPNINEFIDPIWCKTGLCRAYEDLCKEYKQHLASLETIDIAPEYQEYWKVGDLVSENDFIKNNKYKEHEGFFDYGGPQYIPVIEAIPKEQEKDAIIYGLQEGVDNWKQEYDDCRAILQELVTLKDLKDLHGDEDEGYKQRKPIAWENAKQFISKYQHL